MKVILLIIGFLLLISVEILRVYFIMPFPGSQEEETITLAYWLHSNIIFVRIIGLAIIAYPFFYYFRNKGQMVKVFLAVILGFYVMVFYMFNFRYLADQMFLQPKNKVFLDSAANKVLLKQLIVGVTINNESKAYPIEVIGYHHQVRDIVGGEPIMVTYCTVCRSGRIFKPVVDGHDETFRLVGMDHYNAMFEDKSTNSWWRQINGEAIMGPSKGKSLEEIPSAQMSLSEWMKLHPKTTVMQPDTTFSEAYKGLSDYDEGKRKGRLERKDSLSWMEKSWVVGLQIGMDARAYDWIELQNARIVNDVVGGMPVLIAVTPDSISFHSFSRVSDADTLSFELSSNAKNLIDSKTNSLWNWNGQCVSGDLQGKSLKPVQSYQEYWHSWKTFRPQTKQYIVKK